MKRFLTTTFIILALATSVVGVMSVGVPVVHAQTTAAPGGGAPAVPSIFTGTDFNSIGSSIMISIMGLFADLVGIAMVSLNYAMFYTVLNMGNYVSHLAAVGVTWRILRDIGNIALIFGFLAVGITTILNVNWYGGGKKMLPMLLIVAIFLNFSLFISEAVIDAGNLFATQIYGEISGGGNLPTQATLTKEGISDTILSQFGLATIYGNVMKTPNSVLNNGPWYTGFLAIILFLILAFVLFSLAFILIARFVILLFLIIIAPIGFAGLIVPKLDNTAREWWSTLFRQTITAPVLLLLLYIALAIITDANFLTGFNSPNQAAAQNADWLGISTGNITGFANVFLPFLVGMGLLLAVVMVSKRMSAFGSSWATKAAGALTLGAAAYGLRQTVGRGSQYAARKVRESKYGQTKIARVTANAFDKGARGSFDVRGVSSLKNAGLVGDGEAATGGIQAYKEKNTKERLEAARARDQASRIPNLKAAIAANDQALIAKHIGNMSDKELEDNTVHQSIVKSPAAAAAIPQARFDKLMQSDALSDAQKNSLRAQRSAGVNAQYADTAHTNPRFGGRTVADVTLNGAPAVPAGPGVPTAIPAVRGLSSAQRAQLDSAILVQPHVMSQLSASDFTAIARRGELDAASQATMGAYIESVATAPTPTGAKVPPRQASLIAMSANPTVKAYFNL